MGAQEPELFNIRIVALVQDVGPLQKDSTTLLGATGHRKREMCIEQMLDCTRTLRELRRVRSQTEDGSAAAQPLATLSAGIQRCQMLAAVADER
jgi:hypothetical protein